MDRNYRRTQDFTMERVHRAVGQGIFIKGGRARRSGRKGVQKKVPRSRGKIWN